MWKFKIPEIDDGCTDVWEVDKNRRAFEVRRDAIGTAPHKIQMMVATSDYPAGVSVEEARGERWYHPQDAFYGVIMNGQLVMCLEPTPEQVKRFEYLKKEDGDGVWESYTEDVRQEHVKELQRLEEIVSMWEQKKR